MRAGITTVWTIGLLILTIPTPAWCWGWATHHYIAQNYSKHLPAYMDGLQAFDGTVDAHVNDPDQRRSYTPGEGPRHYIDIDFYPEFFAGTLSHDRGFLEAQYGAETVEDIGVVPWAIGEVVATLTQQFQAAQWDDAALTIADLCHYVGDASQPLHCTLNYNGQLTGNYGIHSRYESVMMGDHIGDLVTPPTAVAYQASAVDAAFAMVDDSWPGVDAVIEADNIALSASGGSYNSTYYASLWSTTETLTRWRVNAATVTTAALVFSAWVDAGQPPIPGSSATFVPEAPITTSLSAGPSPFRDALTIRYAGRGPLTIEVFDLRGSRVERLRSGASGEGTLTWRPAGHVAAGLYFVRLSSPETNRVRRVMRIE